MKPEVHSRVRVRPGEQKKGGELTGGKAEGLVVDAVFLGCADRFWVIAAARCVPAALNTLNLTRNEFGVELGFLSRAAVRRGVAVDLVCLSEHRRIGA